MPPRRLSGFSRSRSFSVSITRRLHDDISRPLPPLTRRLRDDVSRPPPPPRLGASGSRALGPGIFLTEISCLG